MKITQQPILDFCESLQREKSKHTSESVPMNFVRCFSTALLHSKAIKILYL